MDKFKIEIQVSTFKTIDMQMEPCKEVPHIAEALSNEYSNCRVTVSMNARIRWAFVNGKEVVSNPDVTEFWYNPTTDDIWAWSCLGEYPAK